MDMRVLTQVSLDTLLKGERLRYCPAGPIHAPVCRGTLDGGQGGRIERRALNLCRPE